MSNFTFSFHFHSLEKEMASHSSVLAWRIPGTAQPGGLLSMGSHRVEHYWCDLAAAATAQSCKEPLKIPQAKFQQNVNHEFPDIQAGFTKGRGIEIKLSTPIVSSKKQENSRKASTPICLCKRLWLTQQNNERKMTWKCEIFFKTREYMPPEKSYIHVNIINIYQLGTFSQ